MGSITNRLLNNHYLLHSFRRDNKKSGSAFSKMHLLGVLLFSGFVFLILIDLFNTFLCLSILCFSGRTVVHICFADSPIINSIFDFNGKISNFLDNGISRV